MFSDLSLYSLCKDIIAINDRITRTRNYNLWSTLILMPGFNFYLIYFRKERDKKFISIQFIFKSQNKWKLINMYYKLHFFNTYNHSKITKKKTRKKNNDIKEIKVNDEYGYYTMI